MGNVTFMNCSYGAPPMCLPDFSAVIAAVPAALAGACPRLVAGHHLASCKEYLVRYSLDAVVEVCLMKSFLCLEGM